MYKTPFNKKPQIKANMYDPLYIAALARAKYDFSRFH